ncbi:MAG TPA: uroporphyrinogen decarboxylase family protein [Candidatus Brocadiia bacterium]|nr:uroporphyrinogen decarboxylase family protein [Candidatus Brocadiia bacterium]
MNKEKLSSRERVRLTFSNQEADRVPIGYSANGGIDRRLKEHFGLKPDDGEGLAKALGVDFRGVGAPYAGSRLHEDIPERGVKVNNWGIHTRWIEHESGGYWDFCDFPLREATVEQVAEWPLPSPDDHDYSGIAEACRRYDEYAINGSAGFGDIINGNGMLRSMEQTLVDLVTDDPAGLLLADRRMDIQIETTRRILEAAKGRIDFVWMGEDLGTQIGPIISMETFRKHIRPRYQKYCDMVKAYGAFVVMHTCGSSSWAYEDFIEIGVHVVDTLQPEAAKMSPEYLKKMFGGRLAFHGCISTAGPVAYGTVDEVVAYCRRTLEIMMPGGGYCFSPTHCLQDNSPTENVVAMYDTVMRHGFFPGSK